MITRFAPSPTGYLHLGHAFSALTAWDLAQAAGGTFLLRIEDIDFERCREEYERAIFEDLAWLGLSWPKDVLRQSTRRAAYDRALARLFEMGVIYPCNCTRRDIRAALNAPQQGDAVHGPDGPVYPGTCRARLGLEILCGDAARLDMRRALDLLEGRELWFEETGPRCPGRHRLKRQELVEEVGDVVLARKDISTAYHLAVVVDDAAQGVSHVVRGADLLPATRIHVVLQALLDLPTPVYHHHRLIYDEKGKRLAKRDDARAIRTYREAGAEPADIRAMVGLA